VINTAIVEILWLEKLADLVKKEAVAEPLLHGLLKLFVARTVNRWFLGVFDGVKAFVQEQPYTPSNI
jgi:hypothetical protein